MTDAHDYPGGEAGEPLQFMGNVWPLLGRSLLMAIGQALVIPSPWTTTSYYRWFVQHIALPHGKQVRFEGQPGDIWYIFMLSALCGYVSYVNDWLQLLVIPLTMLFYLIIVRWFFANLTWEGRGAALAFSGSYWGLLGWAVLFAISFITVIGWAWVMTAMMRWLCRQVEGSSLKLSFIASGWDVLWRSVLFVVSCVFIIPIPWTLHWYVGWTVSQYCLSERPAVR
jgi:hypothetical protein